MIESPKDAALFTIGHSNHTLEAFLALLRCNKITAVADVRSTPFSGLNPQYNQKEFASALENAGIRYAFLGSELGARRSEPECYVDGKARYDLIAKLPQFQSGVARVRRGVESFRVALVCAEKDPLICHRTILVCRNLRDHIAPIFHVLGDGDLETQASVEVRLLRLFGLDADDLFRSRLERIEEAYDRQGEKIAYTVSTDAEAEESL